MTSSAFEEEKQTLLGTVSGWSLERLAFKPSPTEWSAVEVFDHLARTDANITATARRGLQAPAAIPVADRVKFFALEQLFRTSAPVKTPAAASAVLPGVDLDLKEVAERWAAARLDFARLVEEVPAEAQDLGLFRHPVCGWLNVDQIGRFLRVHVQHHRYQLKRIAECSAKAS